MTAHAELFKVFVDQNNHTYYLDSSSIINVENKIGVNIIVNYGREMKSNSNKNYKSSSMLFFFDCEKKIHLRNSVSQFSDLNATGEKINNIYVIEPQWNPFKDDYLGDSGIKLCSK
jgi:hypothetical protein